MPAYLRRSTTPAQRNSCVQSARRDLPLKAASKSSDIVESSLGYPGEHSALQPLLLNVWFSSTVTDLCFVSFLLRIFVSS